MYFYISITQTDKRTDYPGRQIAEEVQEKFDENFEGEIAWVIGEEWHGGNLSYHLQSRPKWFYIGSDKSIQKIKKLPQQSGNISTIGTSDVNILEKASELCNKTKGKFYIIQEIDFCFYGSDKK